MADQADTMKACQDAGLRIVGLVDPQIEENAVLVAHTLTSPKLNPVEDAGYRLTPSGPERTIVAPARVIDSSHDHHRYP